MPWIYWELKAADTLMPQNWCWEECLCQGRGNCFLGINETGYSIPGCIRIALIEGYSLYHMIFIIKIYGTAEWWCDNVHPFITHCYKNQSQLQEFQAFWITHHIAVYWWNLGTVGIVIWGYPGGAGGEIWDERDEIIRSVESRWWACFGERNDKLGAAGYDEETEKLVTVNGWIMKWASEAR